MLAAGRAKGNLPRDSRLSSEPLFFMLEGVRRPSAGAAERLLAFFGAGAARALFS